MNTITHQVWLAQGQLDTHRRIAASTLKSSILSLLSPKANISVEVISSNPETNDMQTQKFLNVDVTEALEYDPDTIAVIRSDGIADDLITAFLDRCRHIKEVQIASREDAQDKLPPTIILYEPGLDEADDLCARFVEAYDVGLIDFAIYRDELVLKIIDLLTKMKG